MKHYLSYTLLFVSVGILNGMDQGQEENRFSICNQIKQIAPNASQAAYFKIAERLSKNNLSACACMTYLMKKRERRAIELIKKNFVSQNSENVIKELYKYQSQKDANEKNGIPLTIHCSPSIDTVTQARIAEKFSEEYRTTIVPTEEFCPSGMNACASRTITFQRVGTDGGGLFTIENPEIGINASFKELSSDQMNAVLAHERRHLKENHNIWNSAIAINRIINAFNGDHAEHTVNEKKAHSKLLRAQESAADRISAACSSDCELAFGFIGATNYYIRKRSALSHQSKNNNKSFESHPSDEKRLLWAQRIYNLKLAEQALKQNFEISKNVGHQE